MFFIAAALLFAATESKHNNYISETPTGKPTNEPETPLPTWTMRQVNKLEPPTPKGYTKYFGEACSDADTLGGGHSGLWDYERDGKTGKWPSPAIGQQPRWYYVFDACDQDPLCEGFYRKNCNIPHSSMRTKSKAWHQCRANFVHDTSTKADRTCLYVKNAFRAPTNFPTGTRPPNYTRQPTPQPVTPKPVTVPTPYPTGTRYPTHRPVHPPTAFPTDTPSPTVSPTLMPTGAPHHKKLLDDDDLAAVAKAVDAATTHDTSKKTHQQTWFKILMGLLGFCCCCCTTCCLYARMSRQAALAEQQEKHDDFVDTLRATHKRDKSMMSRVQNVMPLKFMRLGTSFFHGSGHDSEVVVTTRGEIKDRIRKSQMKQGGTTAGGSNPISNPGMVANDSVDYGEGEGQIAAAQPTVSVTQGQGGAPTVVHMDVNGDGIMDTVVLGQSPVATGPGTQKKINSALISDTFDESDPMDDFDEKKGHKTRESMPVMPAIGDSELDRPSTILEESDDGDKVWANTYGNARNAMGGEGDDAKRVG